MGAYDKGYKALNDAQRQAVNTTEGPVLVIAGPGTGKTQLLAMRVAHILQTSDTTAQNILCLTFTESAQVAMQNRLVSFIAEDAYKVAVHTFHSFAGEVISRFHEYFDGAVRGQVADALTSYEILFSIFEKLPYGHPLVARDGDSFVHLSSVRTRISHLKQAGLNADALRQIITQDNDWLVQASSLLMRAEINCKPTFRKQHLEIYRQLARELSDIPRGEGKGGFETLADVALRELNAALIQSTEMGDKTTPVTTWRRKWITITKDGAVFKDRDRLKKLTAVADIYEQYQAELARRHRRDFDDLIINVLDCIEQHEDLRAALQEQFQYLLVDEYQDTNGAQQRLIEILCDNPVHENRPNLMVVGDDDQAIYGFQGANPIYMTRFAKRWSEVAIIRLTENYRSSDHILQFAKALIDQAEYHHTSTDDFVSKQLVASGGVVGPMPTLIEYDHQLAEYCGLVKSVQHKIATGTDPRKIAIFAPRHRYLATVVPHLLAANIPVHYERRDNILMQPHIRQLLLLAKTVQAIADNNLGAADTFLPELLNCPFWDINSEILWKLQLSSYQKNQGWMERLASGDGDLPQIASWLTAAAQRANSEPLEVMLDILLGTEMLNNWACPFRDYYFSTNKLRTTPADYLTVLSSLNALIEKVKNFKDVDLLLLSHFMEYVQLATDANEYITDNHPLVITQNAVQVMTTHKSKGLEFDVVYIVDVDQDHWVKDRGRFSTISLPANLPIEPEPEDDDEKLRRLYVGVTRAAKELTLLKSSATNDGKAILPLQWLARPEMKMKYDTQHDREAVGADIVTHILEPSWRHRAVTQALQSISLRTALSHKLSDYHLSASHLSAFTDLRYGGPEHWLIDRFMGFPHQSSKDAIYGVIMHSVLEHQHNRVLSGDSPSIDSATEDFATQLSSAQLNRHDHDALKQRGIRALHAFMSHSLDKFNHNQIPEYHIPKFQVKVGDARLYGTVDVIEVDTKQKTMSVIDYKTGRTFKDWKPKDANHAFKLGNYRRQLLFYKLLLENCREYTGYTVTDGVLRFVEPDDDGQIHELHTTFSEQDIVDIKNLIANVWAHMMNLDLPTVTDTDVKASRQFIAQLTSENPRLPL